MPRHDPTQSSPEAQSPAQHGNSDSNSNSHSSEQEQAAQLIQKNYRGYRARRQLQGMGLDTSSRWSEVCSSSFVRVFSN